MTLTSFAQLLERLDAREAARRQTNYGSGMLQCHWPCLTPLRTIENCMDNRCIELEMYYSHNVRPGDKMVFEVSYMMMLELVFATGSGCTYVVTFVPAEFISVGVV